MYVYMCVCLYMCMCMYMCVCLHVCVFVGVGGSVWEREETDFSNPQL